MSDEVVEARKACAVALGALDGVRRALAAVNEKTEGEAPDVLQVRVDKCREWVHKAETDLGQTLKILDAVGRWGEGDSP